MDNSEIFKKNAMKKNVPYKLIAKRYWKYLLGTGGSWFFYNFISYPFGIFAGTILDNVIGTDATFVQTAQWMLLLNCFYLPGSISGALASDRIGRKRTMSLGFFCQGVLGILMGVFFKDLLTIFPLFVILYGIFMMMGEFGPGDMLGLVSAEIYPTAIRGTAYGWSAAIGKFGAFVGTSVFKPAIEAFGKGDDIMGQSRVFILASGLALLGSSFTWFLIPDYSKKALGEEDEDFRHYLEKNGYDLSNLGFEVAKPDVEVAPAAPNEKAGLFHFFIAQRAEAIDKGRLCFALVLACKPLPISPLLVAARTGTLGLDDDDDDDSMGDSTIMVGGNDPDRDPDPGSDPDPDPDPESDDKGIAILSRSPLGFNRKESLCPNMDKGRSRPLPSTVLLRNRGRAEVLFVAPPLPAEEEEEAPCPKVDVSNGRPDVEIDLPCRFCFDFGLSRIGLGRLEGL
ncbi:hypothetical protein BGZ94_004744 [Podila epigama]|nr:hypothetical protein BGZ94_004744 [Podila epigama]